MSPYLSVVKKNTFYSTITISSRLFANVFVFWLMARFYGPEQFGIFTFAHTLATTLIILADFGLDVLLITEISTTRTNKNEIIQKLLSVKLIFVFLAFVLMLLLSQLFPLGQRYFNLIVVFALYLVFTSLSNFFYGVFRGFEKFIFETRVSLISNGIMIVTIIILLFLNVDILVLGIAFMFSRFLGLGFDIYYLIKLTGKLKIKVDFKEFGLLKSKVLIFGLHLIFSYLFFQIDTLLLAKLSGEYSVGIYQSVMKLILLPLVIPDILINSMMPTLSKLHKESKDEWIMLGSLMGRVLFMVIIPISLILFFYSDSIINLIYGAKNYFDAIPVLRIFAITLFIRFLLEPFALMLTTSNRQIVRMYTVIGASLLNVLLNSYFIPRFLTKGAAAVSLIVNLLVGVVYFSYMIKEFRYWLLNLNNLFLFLSSLIIVYSIYLLFNFHFIIEILVFLSLYCTVTYFLFLKENEKNLIVSLLKKITFNS